MWPDSTLTLGRAINGPQMRSVLLLGLLLLAAPAQAAPLNHRDAAYAASAYMRHSFPTVPYKAWCHNGPLDPWCHIHMGRNGCGCTFAHADTFTIDVVIEKARRGYVIHDGFFRDTTLRLTTRPL